MLRICRRTDLVDFQLEELILFEEFVYKREVLGYRLAGRQIRIMFLIILRIRKPTSSTGNIGGRLAPLMGGSPGGQKDLTLGPEW